MTKESETEKKELIDTQSFKDIKTGFNDMSSTIESFAKTIESSEVSEFAKALKDLSSSMGFLSAASKLVKTSVGDVASAIKNLSELPTVGKKINTLASQLTRFWGKLITAEKASTLLSKTTGFLTSAFGQLLAKVALITAIFLIVNKWDEMDGSMKAFTVTLGIAGATILLLGKCVNTAFAPYVAVFAVAASGIALLAGAIALIDASKETDKEKYAKQVKAETEAIKDQTKAVQEQAKAYDDMLEKRKESGYEILAESQMYSNMAAELQNLNERGELNEAQIARRDFLIGELNESLDMNIALDEQSGKLTAESIADIDKRIEAVRAEAMAEVVAAEYKEVYTQAFKNANEIRNLLAEQEALKAKETAKTITYEERKKLKAVEENLTERTGLQEQYNVDLVKLEDMQYQASVGNMDALTEAFMINNDMKESEAEASSCTRQDIDAMMYEGMSEQDKEALAETLLRIQKSGGDLAQYLEENGQLRKDINLNYLDQINSDLAEKQSEGAEISQTGGEQIVQEYQNGMEKEFPDVDTTMETLQNKIGGPLNDIPMPTYETQMTYTQAGKALSAALKFLGINAGLPQLSIVKYAQGGLVEPGQLFLAREAGPELVGSFGSHTAVMNNNQIVESVSKGVYDAVYAVMSKQGNRPIVIENKTYLDGKQITATVEKYQRERGVQLISGNLGYTY